MGNGISGLMQLFPALLRSPAGLLNRHLIPSLAKAGFPTNSWPVTPAFGGVSSMHPCSQMPVEGLGSCLRGMNWVGHSQNT